MIKAEFDDGKKPIDLVLAIEGLDQSQLANLLIATLQTNYAVSPNGPNSVVITGNNNPGGTVKQVGGSASNGAASPRIDAVRVRVAEARWSLEFADVAGAAQADGTIYLEIPGIGPLTTPLSASADALDAADALTSLLLSYGFADATNLGGGKVGFLDDPFGNPVEEISAFQFSAPQLSTAISGIPEPMTFSMLVLGVAILAR